MNDKAIRTMAIVAVIITAAMLIWLILSLT